MYRDARIHPSNTGVLSTHMKFQSSRLRRTRSEARVSRVLFASLTNSSAIRSEDEHSEQGYQSYGKTNASRATHDMSGRTSAASRATNLMARRTRVGLPMICRDERAQRVGLPILWQDERE